MHSGDSLYLFFVFLLCICFAVLSHYLYADRQARLEEAAYRERNLSDVELQTFSYKEITPQGVLLLVLGERAYRSSALGTDLIEGFHLRTISAEDSQIHSMEARRALQKGRTIFFPEGIRYQMGENRTFWSEAGAYNLGGKVFVGQGPFTLHEAGVVAEGKNLRYASLIGEIRASDVKVQWRKTPQ